VPLMVAHGAFGISGLRVALAGIFCFLIVRPDFRRFDRRQWLGAFTLGVTMAAMTQCFFSAVKLIPMGPAITIDFLGPLSIAVFSLRGWPRLLLPLIAGGGVLAVSHGDHGMLLNPAGMLFAAGAGCGWAGYIVLMRHVGRLFSAQEGLCLSLITAGAVALPALMVGYHSIIDADQQRAQDLPNYVHLLLPPAVRLTPLKTEDQFLKDLAAMKGRIDKARAADKP